MTVIFLLRSIKCTGERRWSSTHSRTSFQMKKQVVNLTLQLHKLPTAYVLKAPLTSKCHGMWAGKHWLEHRQQPDVMQCHHAEYTSHPLMPPVAWSTSVQSVEPKGNQHVRSKAEFWDCWQHTTLWVSLCHSKRFCRLVWHWTE
jgi:hypothetical protein